MSTPVFIGRKKEQQHLQRWFEQGLAGNGQVVFVAGEAGSGKTTLVESFVAQMQATYSDLIVAIGNCNMQRGLGDPYLPFREVLAMLTGIETAKIGDSSPDNRSRLRQILGYSAQVLVEVGPDLVGAIVPGAALITTIGKAALGKTGLLEELTRLDQRKQQPSAAIEQSRIYEQYANVLKALSQKYPLLIVLDDLHWADEASIGLLFHLYRRLADSPSFIIGTYRPDEIALSQNGERNLLEKTLAEIKRYAGDVTLDLGQTSEADKRAFTNQLLDSEPNHFDDAFRQQLFQHTDGHPLFTVELLRTLQERGHLVRDAEGYWVTGNLDWETLPARVEGVIEERFGRLAPEQREILNIASVEGPSFTAEVVAQISQLPMRQLLKELSQQLGKQHLLVQEKGTMKLGRSHLSAYQFTHTLFQKYLYSELGQAERRLLHGEVAHMLEKLYAEHTDELSAQLAWHFDQADEPDLAALYYLQAGERANQQGAPQEAHRFLQRTLELLPPTEAETRWQVLLALDLALKVLGAHEARRANGEMLLQLAQSFADDQYLAEAYRTKTMFFADTGEQRAMLSASSSMLEAATRTGNVAMQAEAWGFQAHALIRLNEVAAGQVAIQQALEAMERADNDFKRIQVLKSAWIYFYESGDIAKSLHYAQLGLDCAVRSGDRYTEPFIRSNLGLNYAILGMYDPARLALTESLRLFDILGFRRGRGYSLQNLALVNLSLGDRERAEQLARSSLHELTETGDTYGLGGSQMYLGFILEQGPNLLEASEAYRAARASFEQVGARGLAIEATAGLIRCAQRQDDLAEAGRYVAEVWHYLSEEKGTGIENLIRVYLSCAELFTAQHNDADANVALAAGYHDLMARAAKISDSQWRTAFLEKVPEHQTILRRWQESQAR